MSGCTPNQPLRRRRWRRAVSLKFCAVLHSDSGPGPGGARQSGPQAEAGGRGRSGQRAGRSTTIIRSVSYRSREQSQVGRSGSVRLLGEDYFHDVRQVELDQAKISDAWLSDLEALKGLLGLSLYNTPDRRTPGWCA